MLDTSATLLIRMMYAKVPMPDCGAGCAQPEHNFFSWSTGLAQFFDRRWRFDFAWLEEKIAIELEGGVDDRRKHRVRGRHIRPKGFQDDVEKYNAAAALGWTVFRVTTKDVQEDTANLKTVLAAIAERVKR